MFDADEHFRDGATLEDMAKLKPVFAKENGRSPPATLRASTTPPLRSC